jgi:HSP20 family protein
MSFDSLTSDDWFRKFFAGTTILPAKGREDDWFGDISTGFDEMSRQMERIFKEQFRDLQREAPKELVRENETPEGRKAKQIGPIVYGYSAIIGPDGKPKVREFGTVRPGMRIGTSSASGVSSREAQLTDEREPLADVITTDNEIRVVVELPGANKENIKVNAYDGSVEVNAVTQHRKYRRVVDIPAETEVKSVKSTFKNGLLELVFKKKDMPKGTEIKVE